MDVASSAWINSLSKTGSIPALDRFEEWKYPTKLRPAPEKEIVDELW